MSAEAVYYVLDERGDIFNAITSDRSLADVKASCNFTGVYTILLDSEVSSDKVTYYENHVGPYRYADEDDE